MPVDVSRLRAIIFDYGNTLVEFSQKQIEACDSALALALERQFGKVDYRRLKAIRNNDRRAPYSEDYRENDLAEISTNLVRELYGVQPTSEALAEILRVRFDSFVACIEAGPQVAGFLEELRRKYLIGLVSNYPDGRAVRASLKRVGLAGCFDAVVVSGDVGRVKPHPRPFEAALHQLGVDPGEALCVGDNWLADIQGAKRLGMQAALTLQWDTSEKFDPQPGDFEPDLTVRHLTELSRLSP